MSFESSTCGAGETEIRFGFFHQMRAGKRILATPNRKQNRGLTYCGTIGELLRKPGYCPHVEEPKPPVRLFGMSGLEVEEMLDACLSAFHPHLLDIDLAGNTMLSA